MKGLATAQQSTLLMCFANGECHIDWKVAWLDLAVFSCVLKLAGYRPAVLLSQALCYSVLVLPQLQLARLQAGRCVQMLLEAELSQWLYAAGVQQLAEICLQGF